MAQLHVFLEYIATEYIVKQIYLRGADDFVVVFTPFYCQVTSAIRPTLQLISPPFFHSGHAYDGLFVTIFRKYEMTLIIFSSSAV